MKQVISGPAVPTAHICINKSKLKIHNKEQKIPAFYLEKDQEFQIELYNPTSNTILAKIQLNGKHISQGGLVIRPAERVFLERYIDIPNKFKFDTYTVSDTAEVKKAIEDNGDLRVDFYNEQVPIPYYGPIVVTTLPYYYPNGYGYSTLTGGNILRSGSGSGAGSTFTSGQNISGGLTNTGSNISANITNTSFNSLNQMNQMDMSSSYSSDVTMDSLSMDSLSDLSSDVYKHKKRSRGILKSKSKKIETGRVEAGSESDQKLKTVSMSFYSFAFHTVEYKLLPLSQKINTSEDVNIKRYCTNCGTKQKPEFKFCPTCGEKA